MSHYYVVIRQLGDVGERENFDFDPTFLKNEIPPLVMESNDTENSYFLKQL